MPRMTPFELEQYQRRTSAKASAIQVANDAVDDESALHADILRECKARGWLCLHGSMAHRTRRTPGEPDFVILADNGRVYLLEAKTRTGKLSVEQLGVMAWAKKLKHEMHVVRSFSEFLKLTANQPGEGVR
jgi:hypothetical protein